MVGGNDTAADAVMARVEAAAERAITVARMDLPRAPTHQPRRLGSPFGTVGPTDSLMVLAESVVARIFRIRRDENCGSYVMARPGPEPGTLEVYVVSEASLGGVDSYRRHPNWQVGRYAAGERPADRAARARWLLALYPSAQQMHEDLMQQAIDLEVVTPQDIYAAVRYGGE